MVSEVGLEGCGEDLLGVRNPAGSVAEVPDAVGTVARPRPLGLRMRVGV